MNRNYRFTLDQYNYRKGDFGYSCATCKHFHPILFECSVFRKEVDPGYVCDVWLSPFADDNDENQ